MKQFLVRATILAALVAPQLVAGRLEAQPMGAASSVAIIDIPYVFNNHARFQQLKQEMQREVEGAEKALVEERNTLQQMAQRLGSPDGFKRGSPEYQQLEEEIARRNNELQLQTGVQRRRFLEKEAAIYHSVYQEITTQVKYYAEANGVQLVLRFNGDPVDQKDPQEILKLLNQSVVYNSPAIDITPIILEKVNGGAAPPPTADNRNAPGAGGFQQPPR